MTHVSKYPLSKKQLTHVQQQLAEVIYSLKPKTAAQRFLYEFLTPTEQIMMAKRLAIIAMLVHGTSHYKICNILKVSSSTVGRLEKQLRDGRYSVMEKHIKKQSTSTFDKQMAILLFVLSPAMFTRKRGHIFRMLDEL